MKLTIFGATGRTGNRILKKAIKDGHIVTAFTRNPEKLDYEYTNLTIVEGDVLDQDKVGEAVGGSEAVISALGADDISKPILMLSQAARNIINAMKFSGNKRYIGISGAGILDHPNGGLRGDNDLPPFLQYVFPDQLRAYQELLSSGLNWTLVCPTFMPELPETGNIRVQENFLPDNAKPVPVEDVATLVYRILTENLYIKTRVGVAV